MRTVLSVRQVADVARAAAALRASQARLADAVLEGDELRLPVAWPDAELSKLRPTLPGLSAGHVPLLEAWLTIRSVRRTAHNMNPCGPAGRIDVAYDSQTRTWTFTDTEGCVLTVGVDELDASIQTTDRELGTQSLSTLM